MADRDIKELLIETNEKKKLDNLNNEDDISKFWYEKIKKKVLEKKTKHDDEMLYLVHLLAFLPSGLTIYDFHKIKEHSTLDFGPSFDDVMEYFKEFGIKKNENINANIIKIKMDSNDDPINLVL